MMTGSTFTRRTITSVTLAAGFAASVLPVAHATVTTPDEGLDAGEVAIPVSDGTIPAYRARPKGGANEPVVLVIQEIFGVHEHIKDLCRRFAQAGHYAIAPELFVRQGDAAAAPDIDTLIKEIVANVPDAQVMGDLDAAAAFAGTEGADASRLAATGFCWGGRIVWLYAAHAGGLKAGAAWYGRLVGEANGLRPKHPVDVAGELKAPVLGLYGGKDEGIPPDTVEAMRAALAAAGSKSEIVVYPDAPHGFNADYRPSYRAVDAADAWARCLAWFKANGA
jgi:carboxymethylenebutenolidase